MNKTRISKLLYVIIIASIILLIFYIFNKLIIPYNLLFLVAICLLLLVPGRIHAIFYKDFYTAKKLFASNSYEKSYELFKSFSEQLQQKPWLKKLIWLSWGMYTKNIEAITVNNMGIAKLYIRELKTARDYFERAIELDSSYPIPYYNLAKLLIIDGNLEEAEEHFKKAQKLGFKNTSFDMLIKQVQELYANILGE